MAERSGFYNAVKQSDGSYDRTYNAVDFADYFRRLVSNGVFGGLGTELQVVAKNGLTVTLKAGSAYINGYWYELTEDMDFTLSVNSGTSDRTDIVAITLDKVNRKIYANVREGITEIIPIRTDSKYELIVADISIGVGVATITNSVIHDDRQIGRYCGIVRAMIQDIDATETFRQINAQFNEWFEGLKGKLGTDVATNLQVQIDNANGKIKALETKTNEMEQKVKKSIVLTASRVISGGVKDIISVPLPVDETWLNIDSCYIKSVCVVQTISASGRKYMYTGSHTSSSGNSAIAVGASWTPENGSITVAMVDNSSFIHGTYKAIVVLEEL